MQSSKMQSNLFAEQKIEFFIDMLILKCVKIETKRKNTASFPTSWIGKSPMVKFVMNALL